MFRTLDGLGSSERMDLVTNNGLNGLSVVTINHAWACGEPTGGFATGGADLGPGRVEGGQVDIAPLAIDQCLLFISFFVGQRPMGGQPHLGGGVGDKRQQRGVGSLGLLPLQLAHHPPADVGVTALGRPLDGEPR